MRTKSVGLIPTLLAELNKRQRTFLLELIKTGNVTQSAITAGYSKKTAPAIGSAVLKNVKVKAAWDAIKAEECKRLVEDWNCTAERLREHLCIVGFSDVGRLIKFRKGRAIIRNGAITKNTAAIKSFSYSESSGPGVDGSSFSLSMHDKVKALHTLCEITGLLNGKPDDNEHNKVIRERLVAALEKIK
jgi:phage terminase small subunit